MKIENEKLERILEKLRKLMALKESALECGETEYTVVGRKKNREVVLYLVSFLANRFVNIGRNKYPAWKLNHIRTTGMTPPPVGTYMKISCTVASSV